MLQKWKCILTNWIKCYFSENRKKEQNVSLESLLSVISHLRENLNLDESTSSRLEARTVEEFILEKYPDFKFENGTVEPASEEEIYIVASLLLFFVCVISKDVDIKNAMCSKLSFSDQEVIMKYSKCLMECSSISHTNVKTAIAEACGQEPASLDASVRSTVAETPPVLRSLHCEVRRLQAALDAERFDKNYLQEELARTNLKLEKLLNDKEKHKLDIVNLKAKISLCCGQETEANGAKNDYEASAKLLKQLQQLEEKLVETQGQLDDTQYERDAYKAKIDELKVERDKWLTHSQEENSRVCQLTDELEVERRHVQSLQDLVKELRQHNQLNQNKLDSSQLECDDPDTSIHSVQNLSVCSEVCANVVEVQLGEERAKIVVLKQQIQALQDQLNDLRNKSESQKHDLEDVIFEKDNEILNLKHRINERIEENNNLKAHLSDEVSKLNNEINELEQKLKDNTDQFRQIIEAKMQDIQILQEEKLSLLQSLSNETTKLSNINKVLKSELDIEKNAKLSMREEYENHIMKLNEKVLNRNNELVELQNKISESSEQLEDLQSQLRKEKKTNEDTIEKYNFELDQLTKEKIQIANMLHEKTTKIEELQNQQTRNIAYTEELYEEINVLKRTNQDIMEKYSLQLQNLEKQNLQTNNKLQEKDLEIGELQNQVTQHVACIEELTNNIHHIKELLKEEKRQVAEISQQKVLEIRELQNQLAHNNSHIEALMKNIEDLKEDKLHITEKFSLELDELKQEKAQTEVILEQNILNIKELQNQLSQNDLNTKELNRHINDLKKTKQDVIEKYCLVSEQLNTEKAHTSNLLQQKVMQIQDLQNQLTESNANIEKLHKNISYIEKSKQDIIEKHKMELEQLHNEKLHAANTLEQNVLKIEDLEKQLIRNNANIQELNNNIEELKTTKHDIIEKYNLELKLLKETKMEIEHTLQDRVLEIRELINTTEELRAANLDIVVKNNLELDQIKQEKTLLSKRLQQKVVETEDLQKQISESNASTEESNKTIKNIMTKNEDTIKQYILQLEQLNCEKVHTAHILEQNGLEINQLQKQLSFNTVHIENLTKNIEDLTITKHNMIKKYDLELEQLKEEKAQVFNLLEQKMTIIEELQNQLTQNNASIKELNNNIEQLNAVNHDITKKYMFEFEQLNEKNAQTCDILQQKDLKIEVLQNLLTQNNARTEELDNNIKELKATKQNIIENYSYELEQLKGDKALTLEMLQQKDLKIEELQNLLTQNMARTEELSNNIKELKATKRDIMENYSYELEQLKREKVQAFDMLQQKDLKIKELQNLIISNHANIEELNSHIKQLNATQQDTIEKYSLELELLKNNEMLTTSTLEERALKIRELLNQLTQNDVYIDKLNNDMKELNSTNQRIIEKYSLESMQLNEEKIQTSDMIQQKDLKIEELQDIIAQNNERTKELSNIIAKLQTANQDIIEKYNLELEQLKEEKAKTSEILHQKDLKIKELQNELSHNNVSTEELINNIEKLKSTKRDIIEKYTFKLEQLKQEQAQSLEVLQHNDLNILELQNRLSQNNAYTKELTNTIEELKATKQDTIEKYSLELQVLKEEKIHTENILEQKILEIKELNQNIDDLNATHQDATKEYLLKLEKLREENVQSTNILQQKDIEVNELRNQLIHLNASNEKLNNNIHELTVATEDIVKKYTLDLEQLKEEKVKTDNMLEQKLLEMGELHNQLKKYIVNIEELNKNIDNLKVTNEDTIKTYILDLEHLKEKNVQSDNILKQKALEIEELQNQLVQIKTYIEELNLRVMTADQQVIKECSLEMEELKKEYTQTSNLLQQKVLDLQNELTQIKEDAEEKVQQLKGELQEKIRENIDIESKNKNLTETINVLIKEKSELEGRNMEYITKITELEENVFTNDSIENEELSKLKKDNAHLIQIIEENRMVITNLEQLIKHELQQNQQIREENSNKTINLTNKCSILQEYQAKAEKELYEREKEITTLKKEVDLLCNKLETYQNDLKERDATLSAVIQEKDAVIQEKDAVIQEKDAVIGTISKELVEEKEVRERCQKALVSMTEGRYKLEAADQCREELRLLRKENEKLVKAAGQMETFAVNQEKTSHKCSGPSEKDTHAFQYQVDNTSDLTHSSLDSVKTISDLERIIHDKNRTITTLQSDITYLKSLMADSENKLLDVTKELEVSKENCQQLSVQLKKIVHQKNEELADLKKQVSKMSATENRATEIIKVSAKYQAIIFKRISEIKSNTVLKELTNFGNSANGDNELRRSLNAGSITMEDLENFLETTDRHLKRCSEKQQSLQKERDRLIEVNRINESEIINLKKFLTELSVSFKTFSNIKDLYMQKFSKVVSVQRTVRREILNLDGHITDATMCKLERGYAAVMQDLSECSMNMERWVERCIGRTISIEKIKQAFSSDNERASLASSTFQNTSLEIQLDELENSFQKLLEEVTRAQKGEGAKDVQAITVMEVRAEYEDKLNRMKAKMKQLYKEQIAVFQEKQKEEVADLEREVLRAREKLAESSRAYEEHIRDLTTELWSVGEKFLMKQDEAEWLRRKQRSGSLMSLQQVHSSGLLGRPEVVSRPSDTHSLRSLPAHNNINKQREGRGLHMSDEEGEVFDNRCLKELSSTPRRAASPPGDGQRLSELRWRNSLCPPHLKSSYPAETQFAQAVDEDEIKCFGTSGKQQRKEVGITAYKKPGPPTPSKQAGRLSATDSELRESLRVETDPQPSRKTSTPSRLRALFRSGRNDTEGTPRTKRLSIFRKK